MLLERVNSIYHGLTLELIEKKLTISTMESCTSGLIASLISDTQGASAVLTGGMVTYCNRAKADAGVPEDIIDTYGIYSDKTASAMAKAARERFVTDIGIGVTGTYANADPANADSVPGMVWLAIDIRGDVRSRKIDIKGMPENISQDAAGNPPGDVYERLPERLAYKLITAEYIAEELKERLEQWAS